MKKPSYNKIGKWMLLIGILLLIACILCAFAVGTVAVPILLGSSILINSIAINLLAASRQAGLAGKPPARKWFRRKRK